MSCITITRAGALGGCSNRDRFLPWFSMFNKHPHHCYTWQRGQMLFRTELCGGATTEKWAQLGPADLWNVLFTWTQSHHMVWPCGCQRHSDIQHCRWALVGGGGGAPLASNNTPGLQDRGSNMDSESQGFQWIARCQR